MAYEYSIQRLLEIQETNFEIVDCKVSGDLIEWILMHKKEAEYECPNCHQIHTRAHDYKWIKLKDVPFGNKKCVWKVLRARIFCDCKSKIVVEYMSFRSKHHRLTQRFVNYVEEVLCSKMFTVMDVSKLFDLDYWIIYKIDHDVLYRLLQHMKIPDPIHISVDEKSFRKGHRYVTIVTDVDLGKAVWVSIGNRKESLDEFFRILGPERCAKIKTVAKDLHEPYALSCREFIPQAEEVADKFHVIQRLNKTIDGCRKELAIGSRLNSKKRTAINSMNWVLRYKNENLRPQQLNSLKSLSKLNERLYQAYLLKEAFYEIFKFKTYETKEAKDFLFSWIKQALDLGFIYLKDFAKYLQRNFIVILNIIKHRRSSAISEGINRKINVIKSMAYGYRNIHYFMLKILQRCGVLGHFYRPAST